MQRGMGAGRSLRRTQETAAIAGDACTEHVDLAPSKLPVHRSEGEHVGNQEDDGLKKLIESHVEEQESPDGVTVRPLPGDWRAARRGPSRAFANAAVAC